MSPVIQAEKCRTKDCQNPAGKCRELCTGCYATASDLVKTGQATWAQLEVLNLVGKSRQSKNKFRVAFKQATEAATEAANASSVHNNRKKKGAR